MSAVLAAGMLAVGIALGALIGPGPASSLANGTRAAAVARVLALLALDDSAGAGSQALLAGGAGHGARNTEASSAATSSSGAANAKTSAGHQRSAGGGQSETSPTSSTHSSPSSTHSSPSSSSLSPTKGTGTSAPAGAGESKPARLAPVAHVWLIELPYGGSFTSILGQAAAAPYTSGQLVGQGTLLSSYSSLQTSELAGDATLLSGQVAAAVSTIVAPCPGAPGAAAPAGAASQSAPAAASPCVTSEPAGAQAADAFLHEVVPQIEASAGYREGGLIAITFAATGEGTSVSSPAGTGTPTIAYPTGTQVSTATATGAPGALLLSPFLARPGARLTSAFDQLAPRKTIEELLKDPSKTAHQ